MKENIKLNLEKDVLEGWEDFYDTLNVGVLRIARSLGQEFPPVDVVFEEGVYRLAWGWGPGEELSNYGGHSRAILAFQDEYPLSCEVLAAHRKKKYDQSAKYKPIQEIRAQRMTHKCSLRRVKRNLLFLPDNLRKKFIEENSLIELKDGSLVDRKDYLNPEEF